MISVFFIKIPLYIHTTFLLYINNLKNIQIVSIS